MTKGTQVNDAGGGDRVIASKSDGKGGESTTLYHGKGGSDGKHTTHHRDGTAWRTDSSGKRQVGSTDSGK